MSGPHQSTVSGHDGTEPETPPRKEGRMRAVEGLLATDFGQGQGAAVDRAITRLRDAQMRGEDLRAGEHVAVDQQRTDQRTTTVIIRSGGSVSSSRLAARQRADERQQAYVGIIRRRSWWRAASWVGAVACGVMLAVLVGLAALAQRGNERALIVAALHGAAHVGSGSGTGADARLLQLGDVVLPGETVSTGMRTSLTLAYQDGTAIALTADAQLVVGEQTGQTGQKQVRLVTGKLQADVTRQPPGRPMLLDTTEARAEVLGTTLVLSARQESTQLSVEHGLVRLVRASDMKAVEVSSGKRSIAQHSGALLVQDINPPFAPVRERPSEARDGTGRGLRGEYFAGKDFEERRLVRLDPLISFDWGLNQAPDPALPSTFYSVRWSGEIEPRFTEEYLISSLSDDGVRVWIDGKLIIENWFEHPELLQVGHCTMEAGKRYRIVIEFNEWKQYSLVHLFWQSKRQWRELVPASQLYPPPD